MEPNNICPECGARLPEGTDCQTLFNSFLALEFTDPAYGEVHMLTVACFMIQHRRYSDEALVWMAKQLRAHLEEGLPVQVIRRQAGEQAAQGRRDWKVNRLPGARQLPDIFWSITTVDVADHMSDPGQYCESVRNWARTTLKEMAPLLRDLPKQD